MAGFKLIMNHSGAHQSEEFCSWVDEFFQITQSKMHILHGDELLQTLQSIIQHRNMVVSFQQG